MDKLKQNIFLLDGIGAVVSASLLYFVVVNNADFFGLEPKIGTYLAIVPVFFCIYSLSCHFILRPKKLFSKLLFIIAIGNAMYCLYTLYLIFLKNPSKEELFLTVYGKIYFIGELLIIIPLVILEIRIANNAQKSYDNQ